VFVQEAAVRADTVYAMSRLHFGLYLTLGIAFVLLGAWRVSSPG
jgi:hypothetical protein